MFIASSPKLRHTCIRVKPPAQNGVREGAFGSIKDERFYREHIDDALDLVREAEVYRAEFNTVRPREAPSWKHPAEVHSGHTDPAIHTFPGCGILLTT